ncbi:hypothetical protein LTR08_005428 [Meristemomyces frigidus]|nr:hypothetical protein LTR08_005428 [Meristemomyces frigidus]
MSHLFRFPRPRSVLHLIPLRTAAEFITFTLAINKVTGFYGILALLTGFHLNPLQLSHYLYSLAILALALYLSPAIRGAPANPSDALKVLALAWVYVADAVVGSVYTALFGLGWFVVLAQHQVGEAPLIGAAPGGGTINDTAGFTSPSHTVSAVTVVATAAADALAGQDAVAFGAPGGAAADGSTLGGVVFDASSLASLAVVILLWLLRGYFCLVMLSFARSTVRAHIACTSSTSYASTSDASAAENPFATSRLGRVMLRFPTQHYWLGRDEGEDEWVRATSGRFESGREGALKISVPGAAAAETGVGERERRARSGTGPPVPFLGGGGGKLPQ